MPTRTTIADGAWSAPGTWDGAIPGSGDRVMIGHHVTVTDARTVGEGLDPTVRAIDLTAGSLTIAQDVVFTTRGKLHCTGSAALTMEAGSKWRWDVPAGLLYELKHYDQPFRIEGTAAKRCEFSSLAGGGRVHIPLWGVYPAPIDFAYCDLLRVGDAATPAVNATLAVADSVALRHCHFDGCGEVLVDNQAGASFAVVVEDGRFAASAHATRSLTLSGPAAAGSSFARNAFDRGVHFVGPAGWTVEDCSFGGLLTCAGSAWGGATLRRGLVRDAANADTNVAFPTVEDVYWLEDFAANNPHGITLVGDRDAALTGLVLEYAGTFQDGDILGPGLGGAGTTRTTTIANCLQVKGAGGSHGGSMLNCGSGTDDRIVFRHNTGYFGEQSFLRVGEFYPGHAGMVAEFRSDLAVNVAVGATGAERFLGHALALAAPIADLVTPANATHNAAGPGVQAGTNGKGYDNFTFAAGTPGASDLPLGTDPAFVDPTRNLGTWDASLGGPGTTAAALARLAADPTLVGSSLLPHVREGYRPTNPAFDGAAHDGGTIGAVAFEAPVAPADDPPGRAEYLQNLVDFADGPRAWYVANLPDTVPVPPDEYSNHGYNHDTIHAFAMALDYHPGNADLQSLLADAKQGFLDYYVLLPAVMGATSGNYALVRGLYKMWDDYGDTEARDAANLIRDHSAGMNSGSGLWEVGSREIAYRLTAYLESDRRGFRPLDHPQWEEALTWARGHIDQWIGDPAIWAQQQVDNSGGAWPLDACYIQHFMMGLTGHALATAHEYITEELGGTADEILPSLIALAYNLRVRHWRPTNVPSETHPGDFIWAYYRDGHYSPADGEYGDWGNMISSNFFAYLWKVTGCTLFRDWGDEAFLGIVDCTTIHSPKEYAECFRQVADWDRWRQGPGGSDADYLMANPPFHPYADVGVPSEPIRIRPLKAVTGTVTPSDGEGGTFAPASLTWSGDMAEKTFTYTPASAGARTLTFANDMGLVNPLDQGWVASDATPPPPGGSVLMLARPGGRVLLLSRP